MGIIGATLLYGDFLFLKGHVPSDKNTYFNRLVNNTATLQALTARGYIEILEIGGASGADTVRLLKHENTNQSVLETHNMVQVDIYLINSCNGQEYATSGGHFIKNGNIDYALVHWDHCPARANISRVVNKETGEEIYRR